ACYESFRRCGDDGEAPGAGSRFEQQVAGHVARPTGRAEESLLGNRRARIAVVLRPPVLVPLKAEVDRIVSRVAHESRDELADRIADAAVRAIETSGSYSAVDGFMRDDRQTGVTPRADEVISVRRIHERARP